VINSERKNSILYAALLIAALSAAGFFLSVNQSLQRLDLVFYDAVLPLQNNHLSQQVVVVAVDDISIQTLGRWPWSRQYHAQIVDRLTTMGARAVGIDMLFSEAQTTDPQADKLFARAIARNDRTVLAVAPVQLTPVDDIAEILPIADLAAASRAMGHVDVELDIDGICRRFFLYAGLGDAHWPALALAMQQIGETVNDQPQEKLLPDIYHSGWLRQQAMMISYAGEGEQPTILSYADVLTGQVNESEIVNKYVLLGATAAGLGDAISTPASRSHERMPGVVLNAQILSGLLQNTHLHEMPRHDQLTLTVLLIIISAVLIVLMPLRTGFLLTLVCLSGILCLSIVFLIAGQLWFPPMTALIMVMLVWPLWNIKQLGVERRLRQQLLLRLEQQALHHMATGLPNHYMLEEKLRSLEHSSLKIAALMVLHLSWPGSASIVLGRPMGDHILKAVSERLRHAVAGKNFFIAHLNGDDFAVLITGLHDSAAVKEAALNLLQQLQQPLDDGQQQFFLTPQMGVSTWPVDSNALELLRNAYAAMFKSRIDNSEQLCIYSTDIGQQLQVRCQLEQALIHAMERQEFEVYYQPQINAQSGVIVGVEALLRWHNPILGWVSPEAFIPVAEHVGLIKSIGHWVMETACQQLKTWHDSGIGPLRLAVNVSPIQFVDPQLNSIISRIVEQTGIAHHELELEITESSLMFDLDIAMKIMKQIKAEGFELAIDDFGTGYSSLSNLRHFPLDRLKIDKSFTREIGNCNNATEITLTILEMAQHLGLKVIAEGVETVEQAEFLRRHGCDEFQGFLYSKALTATDLAALLRKGINNSLF